MFMSVNSLLTFKEYQADGKATVYTIPFLLLAASDLQVFIDKTLVNPSYYKLKNLGQPQSELTFISAPKGNLLLKREVKLTRETDYQDNGDLLANTVNNDFDRIYLIMQGLAQQNDQLLKVTDPAGINALPDADQRANKVLAFDEQGQPKLATLQSGTATELAANLADSSDKQKGAALVAHNNQLAYPEKTAGAAINNLNSRCEDLEKRGLPLFTTLWWPNRNSIPAGFVAADGQELPMLTYLDAANAIANGVVPTTTNDDWINNPIKRGCYVATSRVGFFRMPDYNGSYADSLGSLFLRGGNGLLSDGIIQKDAVGDAQVPIAYTENTNGMGAGYWNSKTRLACAPNSTKDGWNSIDLGWIIKSAINTVNMGATDTRPLNVTGCFIVRLFGAVTEIGKADAQQLATDYANIAARISILEGNLSNKKFTIIYPNGGTSDNPAMVAANNRYIENNPFPRVPVLCEAELYINGVWGATGWIDNWGISANHSIETDKIIIQTGASGLAVASNRCGGSLGLVTPNIATAPCRVKVWRV